MSSSTLPEGVLFGMGNPLLDISTIVEQEFLDRYGLKPNDAIMATEDHQPMYKELVEKYPVEYIAGGSVQNSLRVAQWLLGTPHLSTYMGAVGNDAFGKNLREKAESDGVKVLYQELSNFPTGTCAVLLTGTKRSLCANLGAAEHYTIKHFDSDDNWSCVEKAKFFYISGFFLAVSPESIQRVAKYACSKDRPLIFNLSAPFVSQFFVDKLDDVLPYIDILFGNETEAEAFALAHQFGTKDIVEIAKKICLLPKENGNRPRMVVFTQGSNDVIVVSGPDCIVKRFPVEKIENDAIVDTNGAGDAFVGGFLSQYVKEKTVDDSVKCAIWAATHIIQRSGCTFDRQVKYTE